ncbi:hypothetical protein B566_EDAN015761 [Ephemera danica]|nr:hypothetical protein B566_EDAN015761 [Ephemera danica]
MLGIIDKWFQIMVCKEDIVSWYKDSVSYKRVDLMCTLLNMCLPFELRFLGTYLEELGKRDFTELREAETRANNTTEIIDVQCVSDKHTRRKLSLYLSLLHSANYGCSNILYKTLANFDLAEIQTIINNSSAPTNDDENALDELLLLYMMALNHPAFTYEQKSVFGSIFTKLQDEEAKISYPPKPALMCMKAGIPVSSRPLLPTPTHSHCAFWQPPIYMPCTASPDTTPGGATQQFSTMFKPILLPPAGMAGTGDSSKSMHMPEMGAPAYIQLTTYPNAGGPHHGQNSVLLCGIPPPGLAQAMATPNNASASEYHQASFVLPTMGHGEMSTAMGQAPVTSCLPTASNQEYSSPYRSPCASPYGSPVASRWELCLDPPVGRAQAKAVLPATRVVPLVPKGMAAAAQVAAAVGAVRVDTEAVAVAILVASRFTMDLPPLKMNWVFRTLPSSWNHSQQRLPAPEEHLHGMLANMTLANGICGTGLDPRQEPRQQLRDDKRHWPNPAAMGAAQAHNSGSACSSQSESPSPPRSPPQEDSWDQCKEDATRWDKMPGENSVAGQMLCTRTVPGQGVPPRTHNAISSTMMRRPQDLKPGVLSRRPNYNMPAAMPLPVFSNQTMQPLRASTGAIYQGNPTYQIGTTVGLFSALIPQHTSGPASFPPFTPNGITSPEVMYAVPPSSQTSPPPFQVQQQQQFVAPKTASPPPPFMPYAPSYPPPSLSASAKLTCYNCGGANHRGTDCHEPSIEEVMRRGQYRLDFSSPQSSLDQQSLPQSTGVGNAAAASTTGTNPPPPVHK